MTDHSSNTIEVADIFRSSAPAYLQSQALPYRVVKVMNNIMYCRTAYFGGHENRCESCSYTHIAVAVGMPITEHPPHRSPHAELPHGAPTSGQTIRR